MKITEVDYSWNGTLSKRNSTNYIVIHHRAGLGDVISIHKLHLNNGWTGIGYHFYVRKNGEILRGRPIDTIGSHCKGYNSESIGICFEGDYSKDKTMSKAQLDSGIELVTYLRKLYPQAVMKKHSDLFATSCPAQYFPYNELIGGIILSAFKDIKGHYAEKHIEKLEKCGIVNGDGNGNFKPDDVATRADVAIMIANALTFIGK